MTYQTIIPNSGAAPLRYLSPPPLPNPTASQQLVPYNFSPHSSPPKKKKRTKLVRVDTPTPNRPKKPDPSAPKITRPCTECGKKFWSWKALFGHMRCHPERQWRGINPPANLRRPPEAATSAMTKEDHEVAECLLMLANGPGRQPENEKAIVISTNPNPNPSFTSANLGYDELSPNSGYGFECSSCKKVFGSHQALGGHRASHKNVKGCFAIHRGDADVAEDERDVSETTTAMVGLGHKCGICFRVFSSGQALGGHKRCHFEKGGLNCLDLNLPAPIEENEFSEPYSYSSSGLALDLRLGI